MSPRRKENIRERMWGKVDERSETACARETVSVPRIVCSWAIRAAQDGDRTPREWKTKDKKELRDRGTQKRKRAQAGRESVCAGTLVCRCAVV